MKRPLLLLTALAFAAFASLPGASAAQAQDNSNFHLEMNASGDTTAHDLGLPAYPGAKIYKTPKDGGAGSFGFSFGETQFQLKVVTYETTATQAEVIAFYHHALRHYGQVLECVDGKAVGKLAVTPSGLTCSDHDGKSGHVMYDTDGSDSAMELRAGAPHRYRIAAIESDGDPGMTKFALVYLKIPEDDGNTPD